MTEDADVYYVKNPQTTCRDCKHWQWPGTFDLSDYPREGPAKEGWAYGV